jgi:uncharacterized OB-fold protein
MICFGQPESLIADKQLRLGYSYCVGQVGSRFLRELRDNKKIMGIRCPTCNHVLVPPRATCAKCFSKLKEWVEVSDKGTLISYTIVNYQELYHPVKTPFVYGVIQLDGADTGLVHILGELDFKKLGIGMRVQAIFKEERKGDIRDIMYFKPLAHWR